MITTYSDKEFEKEWTRRVLAAIEAGNLAESLLHQAASEHMHLCYATSSPEELADLIEWAAIRLAERLRKES